MDTEKLQQLQDHLTALQEAFDLKGATLTLQNGAAVRELLGPDMFDHLVTKQDDGRGYYNGLEFNGLSVRWPAEGGS